MDRTFFIKKKKGIIPESVRLDGGWWDGKSGGVSGLYSEEINSSARPLIPLLLFVAFGLGLLESRTNTHNNGSDSCGAQACLETNLCIAYGE